MNTKIESLINDLAGELVSTSTPLDAPTTKNIKKLLRAIASACSPDLHPRLAESCTYCEKSLDDGTQRDPLEMLNQFTSKAYEYLVHPETTTLPHEKATKSESVFGAEVSADADPQFLIEFIEKHTTMMEELEGALLDFQSAQQMLSQEEVATAKEELQRFVKGYLHNVKGDAGSVGIVGIERVCHKIEDELGSREVTSLLEQLLQFKSWALESIRAIAEQRPFASSSEKFLHEFEQSIGGAPDSSTTPSSEGIDENANLDLLRELMGEGDTLENSASTTTASAKSVVGGDPAPSGPPGSYTLSGDPSIFNEFASEADDHLSSVENIILEAGGKYNDDSINSIFRSIHSIKGSSSYFGLKEVTETSHKTESVLDEVRDGKRVFDPPLTELVLLYLDLQRQLLKRARTAAEQATAIEPIADSGVYLKKLEEYVSGKKSSEAVSGGMTRNDAAAASSPPAEGEAKNEKLEVKSFIKVDTKRLDQLIDAIGEMGIYSSMLIQKTRDKLVEDEGTQKITHQLEKFVRDLQNIGMSMRLVPIRGLFQKMSRLVWDLSKKVGKEIKFSMEGEDTELDRTIIDTLADPLMHMIRNALDHGVEPPDEREKSGKARQGKVKLSAFHANGSIHICIEDDGRGLDPDKLCKKAVEKGVLRPDEKISKEEAYHLIFAAGFSTAAMVTDVSGRGVGMDVVKRNIESIRGRIRIESEVGKGTKFTIELPLTLAIMDGVVVNVGGERFLIPVLSIVEFMQPSADMISRAFDRGETFYFRGKYLPLYRLGEVFGQDHAVQDPCQGSVIVLEAQGTQYSILVDQIEGSHSTVIKSLGDMFEGAQGLTGCAIMSNGDVALIVDVSSLLTLARENYVHERRGGRTELRTTSSDGMQRV